MSELVDTSAGTADRANVLEAILRERHSCRAFLPRDVPADTVCRLLAMAQRSASWCNSQAWQVIVTSGEGTERFRRVMYAAAQNEPMKSDVPEPSEYAGVYRDRRRAAGFGLYAAVGVRRDDEDGRAQQWLENFRMFGAPHLAIITSDRRLGPYGLVDCGSYVSTFLAAAQSLGVATVPQAAIAMYSDVVRRHFSVAAERDVVCGISFGLADVDHPANGFRTERASIDEAVEWVTS